MMAKPVLLATVILMTASAACLAQSQAGSNYGVPYSGAAINRSNAAATSIPIIAIAAIKVRTAAEAADGRLTRAMQVPRLPSPGRPARRSDAAECSRTQQP